MKTNQTRVGWAKMGRLPSARGWVAALALMCSVGACSQQVKESAPVETRVLEEALGSSSGGGFTGILRASDASLGTAIVSLPDVEVWTQNVVTGVASPHRRTDYNGHFFVPAKAGNYKLCWAKTGFTSACTSTTYNVSNRSVAAGTLAVATAARIVKGRVQLADTSVCLSQEAFFGVNISANVEALSDVGAVLASMKPNVEGTYILPLVTGTAQVRVTCGKITVVQSLKNVLANSVFTLGNHRPTMLPVTAISGGVDVRAGAAPGAVVQLAARATDLNADQLVYHWKAAATSGGLPDTASANATWTLPALPGTYSAYVSVDDGKGGFLTRKVDVSVRTSMDLLMTGTVHDRLKNPLKGAKVTLAGVTAQSDAQGNFSLRATKAASYLLNIDMPGYAEFSKRLTAPSNGQEYILSQAYKQAINPGVQNVITDKREDWVRRVTLPNGKTYTRRGATVTIPANALNLNPPPVGQLYAYVATIDPVTEEMPGDMGADSKSGKSVYLISHGAVSIEIRDSKDTKYNLASGKSATIDVPIQDPILFNDPSVGASIATWTFEPVKGNWQTLPVDGVRIGDHYRFAVSSFSTKNADIEKTNPACVKVTLDPSLPLTLKSAINLEIAPNAPRRREADLNDSEVIIYNVPPNTPFTLDVTDSAGVALNQFTGNTGAAWGGTGVPPLGTVCGGNVLIPADTLSSPQIGSRFLSFFGAGDLATANGYYTGIDPLNLRPNLRQFWTTNGFNADGTGGARTAFINNNDLGLGRDMNCLKKVSGDVACWVTNYGGPDQNPGNFAKAQAADKPTAGKTVGMEYSAIEGGGAARVVKFYIFAGGCSNVIPGCPGDSPRDVSANLDGAGEKFVPNLCTTCHGSTQYVPSIPGSPTPAEVDVGASFREFDVYTYRDGTAGPKPTDPAFGLAGVLGQEIRFFDQNQIVKATNPAAAITELIDLFYPSNAPPSATNVVPCGWRANTAGAPCSGNFSGGSADLATETLYTNVVAKGCRTCHSAFASSIAWNSYKKFSDDRASINFLACSGGFMPHANITFRNFWRSNLPSSPETLRTFNHAATNADFPAWAAFGTCTAP